VVTVRVSLTLSEEPPQEALANASNGGAVEKSAVLSAANSNLMTGDFYVGIYRNWILKRRQAL